MPELPDIDAYLHALRPRLLGQTITAVRVASPFLLRTTEPPPSAGIGHPVSSLRRIGKRIAIGAGNVHFVIHLMIAGRLRWKLPGAPVPKKVGLLALDVPTGTLILTEAGTTRRASLHVVDGDAGLSALDPGGLEVLDASFEAFRQRLTQERHTLKRSLTDPTIFSGIGNAYSDEILHAARLSPMRMSDALSDTECRDLHEAVRAVLSQWRDRLIAEADETFPEHVTAFRDGMAVHGRYGKPCPACGGPVQRIRYVANEANYCPACQTGGRLLADRGLSRLLKEDWPRTLEALEQRRRTFSV